MIAKILGWARENPLPSSEKLVLIMFALSADSECNTSVRMSKLCTETGLNRKTITKSIDRLIDKKLLKLTGDYLGKTGKIPIYELMVKNQWAQNWSHLEKNNTAIGPKLGLLGIDLYNSNRTKIGPIRNENVQNGAKKNSDTLYILLYIYIYNINIIHSLNSCDVSPDSGLLPPPEISEPPQKRSTLVPLDFRPTKNHYALAMRKNYPDPNSEFERFIDYYRARGRRYVDWNRAFNNWLRLAVKYKPQKNNEDYHDKFWGTIDKENHPDFDHEEVG